MAIPSSHRPELVRLSLAAIVAILAASTLHAQSPDPFRPYNRQYDPYTYPMAAPSAEAGQFVGGMPRSGIRGANQFQNYLNDLQGGPRGGPGSPYYRSSVDPNYDPNGTREYRPNREADRSYEQSQELVTRKYLAYFSEKDPKKRAALLREYNVTRGKFSRALSTRRENQTRALDALAGDGATGRRSAASSARRGSAPARTGRASSTDSARSDDSGDIPPPPPIFSGGSARNARSSRTPDDVLNRSRRLGPDTTGAPDAGASTNARSGDRGRRTLPPPPGE
jgi:hypothetical protein